MKNIDKKQMESITKKLDKETDLVFQLKAYKNGSALLHFSLDDDQLVEVLYGLILSICSKIDEPFNEVIRMLVQIESNKMSNVSVVKINQEAEGVH